MIYEYQVLESDAPGVPATLLNEQGQEGWKMCGITNRTATAPEPEGRRWIFYFVREVNETPA